MSDRELLELAAKAADVHTGFINEYGGGKTFCWNPLIDDGDALRLAVKLNLHVQIDFNEEPAAVYIYGGWFGQGIEEEVGECRHAATRRAIVRAAAEVGKTLA